MIQWVTSPIFSVPGVTFSNSANDKLVNDQVYVPWFTELISQSAAYFTPTSFKKPRKVHPKKDQGKVSAFKFVFQIFLLFEYARIPKEIYNKIL